MTPTTSDHHEHYPVSLSMPLRLEAKKKRTRLGVILLVIGLPLLALGIFGFLRGGAMMLGVWGSAFGAALLCTGAVVLKKASQLH